MKKILLLILSSTVFTTFADTLDENKNLDDQSGAYINLNLGLGIAQNTVPNSFAGSLNAGYKFNSAFAVEGGYTSLMGGQTSDGLGTRYSIYDAAVKGTLPLSDIFSLYGRIGAAVGDSSWSGSVTNSQLIYKSTGSTYNYGALAGIGASFALSQHFDLRAEDYVYLPVSGGTGNFGNVNVLAGGVQYNF